MQVDRVIVESGCDWGVFLHPSHTSVLLDLVLLWVREFDSTQTVVQCEWSYL